MLHRRPLYEWPGHPLALLALYNVRSVPGNKQNVAPSNFCFEGGVFCPPMYWLQRCCLKCRPYPTPSLQTRLVLMQLHCLKVLPGHTEAG